MYSIIVILIIIVSVQRILVICGIMYNIRLFKAVYVLNIVIRSILYGIWVVLWI